MDEKSSHYSLYKEKIKECVKKYRQRKATEKKEQEYQLLKEKIINEYLANNR